jgi:hypothetical protein
VSRLAVTAAAHHDVLFLDVLSAFHRQLLDVRQPSWTPAGGSELKSQLDAALPHSLPSGSGDDERVEIPGFRGSLILQGLGRPPLPPRVIDNGTKVLRAGKILQLLEEELGGHGLAPNEDQRGTLPRLLVIQIDIVADVSVSTGEYHMTTAY